MSGQVDTGVLATTFYLLFGPVLVVAAFLLVLNVRDVRTRLTQHDMQRRRRLAERRLWIDDRSPHGSKWFGVAGVMGLIGFVFIATGVNLITR